MTIKTGVPYQSLINLYLLMNKNKMKMIMKLEELVPTFKVQVLVSRVLQEALKKKLSTKLP